jgi:hypothetical protein
MLRNREAMMLDDFKHQLDMALDLRHQRRRQHEAEQAESKRVIENAHAELERKEAMFCGAVRSLMDKAVAEANRHLSARSERCQLKDVSGHFTGPWYPGQTVCNPIAYELQDDGQPVGETLLVELTHQGAVEASLCAPSLDVSHAHVVNYDVGWPTVALNEFSEETARDIVLRYVTAVAARNLH